MQLSWRLLVLLCLWLLGGCHGLLGFSPTADLGDQAHDGPCDRPADQPGAPERADDGRVVVDTPPRSERPLDLSPELDAFPLDALPLDPKAACGRPSVLVDALDDGTPAAGWVVEAPAGTSAVEGAGGLILTPDPNKASTVAYRSRHAVNLAGDRIRVQVTQMPPTTSGAGGTLGAEQGSKYLRLVQQNGQLIAIANPGGILKSVTYDPVKHRWWQLRSEGGKVFFETSPEGKGWSSLADTPAPAFASWATMILAATSNTGGTTGKVGFASFNAGRPPADWCKADTFQDLFNGTAPGLAWSTAQSGACTVGEGGGSASFSMSGAGTSLCSYETRAGFDLIGSWARIYVPVISLFYPPVEVFLLAEDAAGSGVELAFVGKGSGVFRSRTWSKGSASNPVEVAYQPTHEWWRARESAGTLLLETAPASSGSWTIRHSLTAASLGLDARAVHVSFGVRTTASMGGAVPIGVPQYN